jgi:sulfite reductase beta subunit-like hemoprotein
VTAGRRGADLDLEPDPHPEARMTTTPAHASTRARTGFAEPAQIDGFAETLGRFERGELEREEWRAYRVLRGAYGQRQDGVHMLRVKIPQGIADAAQLRALADVAVRWSRGFGHVTTRQNFQLHFLRPGDLEPALRRLASAGITTAGAGGNAVRNVVACPLAGVSRSEVFDPTPYAEAVTRHFLRHPLAATLPRKFKIAFEGCLEDHAGVAIQDLGFRARLRERDGRTERGFEVTAAGGTASLCTSGAALVPFLPAADLLALAEAVVRAYHAHGDRTNKQRNRLKFLVRDLGLGGFRRLVEEELARVRREGAPELPFDPERPPEEAAPPRGPRPASPDCATLASRVAEQPRRGPGEPPPLACGISAASCARDAFVRTNVRPQRQSGFSVVTVSLPQGDVRAAQLEALADLATSFGDGSVRFGSRGEAHLRWIADAQVPALFARLAAAGLARDGVGSAADVVACPGAEACRQAVTRTREVARLVEARVRSALGARATEAPLEVAISGCPNGCSRHHVAALGLQGSARKVGGRSVPQYFVLVGGGVGAGGARFGKLAGKVPARRVPEAVEKLVALYLAQRTAGEDGADFFTRAREQARAVLAPFEELRIEDARAEDFVEPGQDEEFRPEVQDGECAA